MSKPLFSWRHAILESDLQPTTRHVLHALSCHMSDAGDSCFPTVDRLARETGLSRKAVCIHIAKAKKAGYLLVDIHGFGGQRWRRHEYMVAVPKGGERRSQRPESKVVNVVPEGGEPRSKGGEPDDQKVVNEVPISTSVNSTGNSTENSTGEGRASARPPARVNGSAEKPKHEPKNRGKRMVPADWAPDDKLVAWCEKQFPTIAWQAEVEKFRDRSRAKDERYKDFAAGFRNWMRMAAKFQHRDGGGGGRPRRMLD